MSEQNQDKHQQRQQKVKEKVDERIAAAQKEQLHRAIDAAN